MRIGNAMIDQAEARVEREREVGISAARAALRRQGTTACVDCGATIALARKRVYPAATRCLECQDIVERESYLK